MLFKTRFRYVYIFKLKLANLINSLTHYTKGTLLLCYKATIVYKYLISDLFHCHINMTLFHLSFTVLVHYRL